jgi:hypothetical protein
MARADAKNRAAGGQEIERCDRRGADRRITGHEVADADRNLRRFVQSRDEGRRDPRVHCIVMLEDETYRYAASEFLVVSVDRPAIGHVMVATPEKPYFTLQLESIPGN